MQSNMQIKLQIVLENCVILLPFATGWHCAASVSTPAGAQQTTAKKRQQPCPEQKNSPDIFNFVADFMSNK